MSLGFWIFMGTFWRGIVTIIPVENARKRNFDENGKRR